MSAIDNRSDKKSSKNTTFIIAGVIALGAGLLFAYLMFYTAPAEREMVKVIAVTDDGCIAETMDGYSVNIGDCNAKAGQFVDALVDQKTKERAALMNPTN